MTALRRKPSGRLRLEQLEDRCVPHGGITEFSAGITADAALAGIVLGPDANFWFAEFNASRIGRITPAGEVTEFTLPAGRGPLNITVGPDGNLYFTENTGDRIGRINPLAGSSAAIQASIVEFAVPGAGSMPNDIAAGADGALWFTQTGSDQIGRLTLAGVITEFAVPGAGSSPAGITAGSDGALWFTQAGSGQIGRITTAGTVTEFLIPVPNGAAFSDPEDIVSGPGGALFFTDFGRDQIGRITTSGQITQFNLATGRGPQGIVAAKDGDLYFTMAASGRIGRLPAASLIPGKPTSGSPPLEEFSFIPAASVPLGITTDANGDIWFTENAGNKIGFFQAHLAQLTLTATGPTAKVFDRNFNQVGEFTPFPGFQGTFHTAVNDLNDTGVPDNIVIAGPGGRTHVKVFEGSNSQLIASFFAFDPTFQGLVSIAAEDVNGDGRPDIIVAAGTHIKVIDGFKLNQVQANGQIADNALLASFYAFDPAALRSVTLAGIDLNGDRRFDIMVGAGPGAGPHVKIIDATKLNQVQANGQIADSALLASFFAFDPGFKGGVNVAVGFNDVQKKIVVGAGPGAGPHVRVIDGAKLNQVQANGQIAESALLASFFAFGPGFQGGVRVSSDDINSDAQAELILAAGPGAGPQVVVIDGAKLNQVQPNGQIADSALIRSFLTGDPGFSGGVFIAADADHRDGPILGPPGVTVTNARRDVNDMFIFQSPTNVNNTVLVMDVSPFSTASTPAAFEPGVLYDFRIVNRDFLNATDDLVVRMTFGPTDATGVQDVAVRALPAARFAGAGGVIAKGVTGQNLAVRGVGGTGAMFRAAEQDDPFFFDSTGFQSFLLNNPTAVQGVIDGDFPRGTSDGGTARDFSDAVGPDYNAPNFFGPNVNTMSIILEIPSARLTGAAGDAVGFWGRTEVGGAQVDRMGRPAINTTLIPPVPRGSQFPIGGTTDLNRQDVRTAFNTGHPRDDRATFGDDMTSILTAFFPAGRPGGVPDAAQAQVVTNLLLPDILVYRPSQSAGFFGDLATVNGTTFLAGGRKLSDNIIDIEIRVLTDDDLPAALGGGPNPPALFTQNVRDDNGQNLTDGSIDLPIAQGGMGTGQRPAVFPYIGARNPNPTGVPSGNPPA